MQTTETTTVRKKLIYLILFSLYSLCCLISVAYGLDTDVYKTNLKPNVAIMFDTSGSMEFGVYDHTVDYGGFYNYASEQGDYDLIAGGGGGTDNYFYAENGPGTPPQYPRREILLVKGNIGVTITSDGVSYTGDAGDPDYLWYVGNLIHTYTFIDEDGNLSGDGTHTQRITVDGEGHILLDGERLPLDRDIPLHNWQENTDGTKTDLGFGGQVNAPGWYFSGFEGVGNNAGDHNVAESGDVNVYFFITGNWINMQMMYNLYTENVMDERYRTWKTRTLPDTEQEVWHTVAVDIHSPNYDSNYPNKVQKRWDIVQADARQIKIHFERLKTYNRYDFVKLFKNKKTNANLVAKLYGDRGTDFWMGPYDISNLHTLIVKFRSNRSKTDIGFKIDKYQYLGTDGSSSGYKMQRRIDVVRDAIIDVINITQGKINWALTSFNRGNGARILQTFSDEDEATVTANIISELNELEPNGGTPLGEALQDIFNLFADRESYLPECSRNYCITISDGFPSADSDWSRISGKTFTDTDGDGWTEDPYQYNPPPEDYFDDVATYLYTRSFRDRSLIDEPETSYDNITNHMLSFIQGLPLLKDAAEEGGGLYLAAYNKQQLVNAFYSLGLLIIKSTSYVAPVISVDTSNKTQNGDMLYMAFFKPTVGRWSGNLKKYQLVKEMKSNCPERTEEEWVVTDQDGLDAVDCTGTFYESSTSFWSTESDGGEVEKGGVGAILKAAVEAADMTSSPYLGTGRHIYILGNDGSNTQVLPENISNEDLGVDDDAERYKIINFLYGYTYDEDGSSDHYPVARRNWPLGSFIHSSPVIINYESEDPAKTYIVIGGNDGMLHVFDDENGSEVIAFIPENLLPRLKELNPDDTVDHPSPLFLVDGPTTYYYSFNNDGQIVPKQLIFGERRGGKAYYSINISDPTPANWTKKWYIDNSQTGFEELGQSWSKISLVKFRQSSSATTTVGVFCGGYDNSGSDRNDPPGVDSMGRGLFIIDINKTEATPSEFLIKSITYSATATDASKYLNYAVPCDPLILTDDYGFLNGIYFSDLGGQVWYVQYDNTSYSWASPRRVFTANPGYDTASGQTGGSSVSTDNNRKMFYPPTVTYLGKCNYIKAYNEDNPVARDPKTLILTVGTGDREAPMETDTHNRIYTVIDAPVFTASLSSYDENNYAVLNEGNLLNVTMDELDVDSTLSSSERETLQQTLSKTNGWYIKLDEINDNYLHEGEKVLSQPLIFYGISYITTFTPNASDPCFPHGEAKIYALHYCDGTAGLNYYKGNDVENGDTYTKKYDYRDRYRTIGEAIPSSPKIIIRDGVVAAFSSVGGGLPGLGEDGSSRIPQPKFSLNMINWRSLPGDR